MDEQRSYDDIAAREANFWDQKARSIPDIELMFRRLNINSKLVARHIALLGDVKNKRILDVGCGTGQLSVILAQLGAEVWSIDVSPKSVEATRRSADFAGLDHRIHPYVMSATNLDMPDQFFDLVHGYDIVHHLNAKLLALEVARVLKNDGRAVFSENSANNGILMLARNTLCGRFGISKCSSNDEYPLTREKIEEFGQFFHHTEIEYPHFVFFHFIASKFFGMRNKIATRFCRDLDSATFKYLRGIRKYSYRQVIHFRHPKRTTTADTPESRLR